VASECPDVSETLVWRLHHTSVVGSDSCTLLPKNAVSVWGIVFIYIASHSNVVWAGC
jgi:hypothetical protein